MSEPELDFDDLVMYSFALLLVLAVAIAGGVIAGVSMHKRQKARYYNKVRTMLTREAEELGLKY